jgi:tRNA A58 N-methylase Trm61
MKLSLSKKILTPNELLNKPYGDPLYSKNGIKFILDSKVLPLLMNTSQRRLIPFFTKAIKT